MVQSAPAGRSTLRPDTKIISKGIKEHEGIAR